jgi:hypothetical protein
MRALLKVDPEAEAAEPDGEPPRPKQAAGKPER